MMANKVVNASLLMSMLLVLFANTAQAIPPVLVDDQITGVEDTPVSGNVLTNDSPTTGPTLTVVGFTGPAGLTVSGGGVLDWTPPAHFSGVQSFTYDVREDDPGLCSPPTPDPDCFRSATGDIFVAPVAELPIYTTGSPSGNEDASIPLGIGLTPVDPSEQITLIIGGLPTDTVLSAGTQQLDDSWVVTQAQAAGLALTPPPNFNGPLLVNMRVISSDEATDLGGSTVTDTVQVDTAFTVTVNPVDDDPVLTGAIPSVVTPEDADTTIDLAGIVTDPDGDALTYTATTISNTAVQATNTTGSTLEITVVPNASQLGGSVAVEVSDPDGGTPVVLNVPVDVTPVNDNPTQVGPIPGLTTDEDVNGSVDLAGVVDDADLASGDSLSYAVVSWASPAISGATFVGSILQVTVAADLNDTAASVLVEVTDNDAVLPVALSVPVSINPVNDDPFLAGAIPTLDTDEDVSASVDLAGVVDDVDIATNGDSLSYSVIATNNSALAGASMVGSTLSVTVDPNEFEVGGDVTVRVIDAGGAPPNPVDVVVPVNVNPVNDDPVLASPPVPVDVPEDSPNVVVSYTGAFTDADIVTGDSLNYAVTVDSGGSVFDGVGMLGDQLTLDFAADANGVAGVLVTATDSAGATATHLLSVTVQPVNDAPILVGSIGNRSINEDDPPEVITIAGAGSPIFDDVDIATNADVLAYEVSNVANPALFTSVVVSGDDLVITLFPDANGTSDISVIARDLAGAVSPPATFTVTVNGVDDFPIAADDSIASILEDSPEIRIDVLANDYLAEQPTQIERIESVGTFDIIDENGDVITNPHGTVLIDGSEIVFTPTADFFGEATFEYVIRDVDGDEDTGMVTFTVTEVNDAPIAAPSHFYSVFEGATLDVEAINGLLLGSYDIDPSLVDGAGDPVLPQPLTAVITSFPPGAEGQLTSTTSDGAFVFSPETGFIGTTGFTYAVSDNTVISNVGNVVIEVLALPPVAAPPNPGEVAVLFNLANTPLEQSATVEPNVLVSMDDSGSMDWHITVDSTDDNGRFVLSNAAIANSSVRSRTFTYLFNLNVNAYGSGSSLGRVLPSEESLPAGNGYNVWQARSSAFNNIYYDPNVTYEPWTGLDNGNVDFADANPTAIRLDPVSGGNLYDITTLKTYTSNSVPDWDTNGGTSNLTVTNFYIPRYYTPTGTLVEIRNNGSVYPGIGRDDCAANNDTCTYAEEIQNFANWFQYYRSREHVAKAAVGNVVAELQDIRVGYETINRRSDEPIAQMNDFYFEGEKRELLDTIYNVNSSGGTPLRRALNDAGRILACDRTDRDCPALPEPEGICQQNFSLLFSDGYWNGSTPRPGNFDEDGPGVFDGGKYADTHSNTLADIAMYYYENDMFPAVEDGVPLTTSDFSGVPDGTYSGTSDFIHQHMKTFTIAFGVEPDIDPDAAESALPGDSFTWPSPTSAANAKIDDMLHAAINGRGRFLNAANPQELQRAVGAAFREFTQAASSSSAAAFNSTSLREGTLLYRGFYDLRNRTGELTASEVSTAGVVSPTTTWEAATLLDPSNPSGLTPAQRIIFTYDRIANTGIEFEFNSLNANQQLTINEEELGFLRGERTFEEPAGDLRRRLDEQGLLGDIVNSSPIFVGAPRILSRDQSPYPTGPGELYSEFANTIESRTRIVYVGANDGMMHGFDAITGEELMAYVPNAILDGTLTFTNKISAFTSPFYLHEYFVDLTPRITDAFMRPNGSSSKRWITTLVGGLGAGGKGYYGLNITNPDTLFADQASAAGAALWEFTEADDTYPLDVNGIPIGGTDGAIVDFLGNPVTDLGYSFSLPTVTMSNIVDTSGDNEWVAIFGNGANSSAGIATLFVLLMDRGIDGWQSGDFIKLSTGAGVPLPGEQLEGFPNGLGTPTGIDLDFNGTVDLVYAGDRLGNLWRFNIESADPDLWTVTRVFTATFDNAGVDELQPILSKPLVTRHPEQDGFLITFGTGSFIAEEDGTDSSIQSIYTIWDQLLTNPPTANANTKAVRLIEQTLTNVVDDAITPAQTRRILSTNSVSYTPETTTAGVYGWYIDLDMVRAENTLSGAVNSDTSGLAPPDPQFPGEKAVRRFIFRDGVILTTTVLPTTSSTSCFGARPGALLIIDAVTGGDPGRAVIDFNQDGVIDDGDLLTVGGQDFTAGIVFDQSQLDGQLVDLSTLAGEGDTDFLFICGGTQCESRRLDDPQGDKTGRLSWSELQ